MKKAQMEMIGLVIIVILITLGMLFLAIFSFKDDQQKKFFTRKGLAYSTMSTVMKTTIVRDDCSRFFAGDLVLPLQSKLLEDCALYKQSGIEEYSCNGKNSCEFVRDEISKMLESTLGKWNKKYSFESFFANDQGGKISNLFDPIVSKKGGCPRTVDRDTSGLFPLETQVGLVDSIIYICD